MSWYTKFRPATIGELHLESVRTQFESYMKSGLFPQVFLFAGPKGTGKTSTSRILGAMLNDPKNKEAVLQNFFAQTEDSSKKSSTADRIAYQEPTVDSDTNRAIISGKSYIVQELDAASNRGIDDVRSLKERVQLPPQEGLMSVYILDEAHMLTTEAFNALLKLLEEPPAHSVFILATTERHKIPATVLSRTAEISFQTAKISELVSALSAVLNKVSMTADEEVLNKIAAQANGSFRDAVKLLEMVATASDNTHITLEQLEKNQPGLVDDAVLIALLKSVITKDSKKVVQTIAELRTQGLDAQSCYRRVLSVLHTSLLQSVGVIDGEAPFSKQISLFFLDELQHLQTQPELIPLLQLEILLLKIIDRAAAKPGKKSGGSSGGSDSSVENDNFDQRASSSAGGSSSEKKLDSIHISSEDFDIPMSYEENHAVEQAFAQLDSTQIEPVLPLIPLQKSDSLQIPEHGDSLLLLNEWDSFLDAVQNKNATIAALLRSSKPLPEKSNGIAKVQVFYQFHRDQLMQPKFLQLLQECAQDLTGQRVSFDFEVGKPVALVEDSLM
jgi:DNA polymerase III subunit gamma/tau